MIWILSVWLAFVNVPQPITQHWQHEAFETKEDCFMYLADNKIEIVDSILEQFRNYEGKLLKNFEFFCENKKAGLEI